MSEYNKLKTQGLTRGRPKLSPEEKLQRKELNVMRQEARRRATIVLQHRHAEEFAQIIEDEMKALGKKK